MRHLCIAAILCAVSPIAATAQDKAVTAAVATPDRPAAERARDQYRHPVETLTFFKIAPGQTVAEFFPGGGWYTRILLPLVGDKGHYIAVTNDSPAAIESTGKLVSELAKGRKTSVQPFVVATATMAPAASVDRVLTFRNVHNLLMAGARNNEGDAVAASFFQAAFKALKPGGFMGVVDHRLPETASTEQEQKSGYVKRSTIVRLATAAGFVLDGESEINANPKDSANWPDGVWTLPPTLKNGDVDREKYLAIGESDRLTLRFRKP
ncbi:MAG: methyltransferase [Sphingobium sp.]|nr:methyltransferase [Sphingobium sp.]